MDGAKFRFRESDRAIFNCIVNGRKLVETRAASPKYLGIKAGDKISFVCGENRFSTTVRKINKFKTLKALLNVYSVKQINPLLSSKKALQLMYVSFPNYKEAIKKYGLVVFELEGKNTSVSINACSKVELDTVRKLLKEAFLAEYPSILNWFDENRIEFATDLRPIWFLLKHNKVIGLVVAHRKQNKVLCNSIYVKTKFRRFGYGTMLIKMLEDFGRKNNLESVYAFAFANSAKPISFFKSQGFEKSAPFFDKEFCDGLRVRLEKVLK